ncbi:MAG: flagellar basal body-associated FliL family protein [bacterium]
MPEEEVLGEEEATAEETGEQEADGGGAGGLLDFSDGLMDSLAVKLLTGAIVLVAIVLIVIGVSHYMMESMLTGTSPQQESGGEVESEEPGGGREPMNTMKLENDFMISKENPRTNRMRTLKITIHLGFREGAGALTSELEERMPQIRDRIYSILGNKSFEELNYENMSSLKDEIRTEINTLLVSEYRVQEVFFSELMIQ